jgi:AcrR family transcriptional regulator
MQTRAGILEAVGRLLARSGCKDVGGNAIAREAGVEKVLIHRYFGGLPELLKTFAEETGFWPGLPELTKDADPPLDQLRGGERAKALPKSACASPGGCINGTNTSLCRSRASRT